MRVTLTHITAAYLWLMTPMDGLELRQLPRRGSLGACPATVDEVYRLDFSKFGVEGIDTELLTCDCGSRPRPDLFRYHVASRDFPPGAFVVLDADVQVVSPELSFWQMARVLPFGELVKYGDALCSLHSFSCDSNGHPLKRREPLTTIARLGAFVRSMGSFRRNKNAYRALSFIVERSESPMESCTTVLLCLKRQYGGFGLVRPVMGHVVELDEVGRSLTGTVECRCDMYWQDAHYDLEYDSDSEHSDRASAAHDSLRRTAIRHMGITVGELRWAQLKDPVLFEATARLIAKDIGHRIVKRDPELEFKYSQAYLELRRQLFWRERRDAGEDPSPLHVAELAW